MERINRHRRSRFQISSDLVADVVTAQFPHEHRTWKWCSRCLSPRRGHWSCYLQYPIGLRALGHDVFWLELLPKSRRTNIDDRRIGIFFARMRRLGFGERCAVLLHDRGRPPLVSDECIYGIGTVSLKEIIRNADVLEGIARC
jgi:hypothetical protein